jgi:hypothetical protein
MFTRQRNNQAERKSTKIDCKKKKRKKSATRADHVTYKDKLKENQRRNEKRKKIGRKKGKKSAAKK